MEKKYKITYNEANVMGSVPYILVKEFDLTPNILKADINGDGTGIMIVGIEGDNAIIAKGVERIREAGYTVDHIQNHICKNEEKCWHCGACVSLCPTHAINVDPETAEIRLNYDICIACGSCVNSCSVKALKLVI